MRFSRWTAAVLGVVTLPVLGFTPACGDDDDGGGARGDVVCSGSECQCPSTGDCAVDCVGDCALACTGSGDCGFSCGAGCDASCPGSGLCIVDVGHQSTVSCTGSGGCDVVCHGDCVVECPGSGDCVVHCAENDEGDPFACEITRCENVEVCDDGVQVCNARCPG
jgi:hypothetical protein